MELLPCPWCPGQPEKYPVVVISGEIKQWCISCEGERHTVKVYGDSEQQAIKVWNTRNLS